MPKSTVKMLSIVGTRPEAIKMAPVILQASANESVCGRVCVTAQHRQMLDQVMEHFSITPDIDLDIMKHAQGLGYVTSAVLEGVGRALDAERPDWVLVQGDTTTTFAGALAAFYRQIPVAHVEAGLRTGNLYSPWPEEANRRMVSQLAALHFAPTLETKRNLLNEGVDERNIVVTGNTVIDALLWTRDRLKLDQDAQLQFSRSFSFLRPEKRTILVTGHRRENFDGGLKSVFEAIAAVARRSDVQVVFPVHLNPVVQAAANSALAGLNNVFLIPPQGYREFVWLMSNCYAIVTDSGGVQEEAPSLGKPVLVTRDTTERPEAVEVGAVELVGTDGSLIAKRLGELLDDDGKYGRMSTVGNPYGDGNAAAKIIESILERR